MSVDKFTTYRDWMYVGIAFFSILALICGYFANVFNNKLTSLKRDAQTTELTEKIASVNDDINKNIDSTSQKHTSKIELLAKNTAQGSGLAKEQLEFLQKQEQIKMEENKRLFTESRDKLTSLFPSQDFSNFLGQIQRYEQIKVSVQEAIRNPFCFISQEFEFTATKLISRCEIMKAHFHNRSVGEESSICNNRRLSGIELDKCMYDSFAEDYVFLLNLFGKVMTERTIESYERNLKSKGQTTDQFLESLKQSINPNLKPKL